MIFGWRLDEERSLPGCAPLWAWCPVMEQMELLEGMEVAGHEGVRGRETSETGFPLFSK